MPQNSSTAATTAPCSSSSSDPFASLDNGVTNKRKRKPAGTPDPEAEVVSLSPRTLLESDRYVCEICNQGFQRDQNLQMHRRRHKVPWKLVKRETTSSQDQVIKKRVYVCPEPSCLHHHPSHALGDLVGIKKHFRRKHSNQRQWVCDKCSKAYAVHSDYKAHLKTCGTRGHSCDCGRVFSRVESFIEHQDACTVRQGRSEMEALQPAACSSRTASSASPSSDANLSSVPPPPRLLMPTLKPTAPQGGRRPSFLFLEGNEASTSRQRQEYNLELQLLPSSSSTPHSLPANLNLSIGSSSDDGTGEKTQYSRSSKGGTLDREPSTVEEAKRVKEFADQQLMLAMVEKKYAEEARLAAKRQIEMAELEFANAKNIRQRARAELEKAQVLREEATKRMSSTMLQITCQACKAQFQASTSASGGATTAAPADETSLAMSYMSSATTEGDGE
ncbi:hypothetical protein Tsubulata_039259 [Turnera subulata]|uniref:C2H2-type domain-containing protein n=1 Tax=Turnera subulata TaxID=218843 RepID=A0A9Q0FY83_9ROSI|nr:hypothetical protein Tsubulata_039259 [Turnera subulata]